MKKNAFFRFYHSDAHYYIIISHNASVPMIGSLELATGMLTSHASWVWLIKVYPQSQVFLRCVRADLDLIVNEFKQIAINGLIRLLVEHNHLHYSVSQKKYPPEIFWHFFPNGWEFLNNFLHTYYTFLSTLDYKFLFNYLQLWRSYATLSVTTQFTSYAQCPPSAETHAFRCLRKSLIALLIVVCGKSSQICCSALFSSGMVFGFDWSLWNAWSITYHTC